MIRAKSWKGWMVWEKEEDSLSGGWGHFWLVSKQRLSAGKIKVLIKTHKPDMPVWEVFSVCSQPVEKLSSFFQFSYLGPIVNYGVLKWRLKDTNEFIRFLHPVNDHLFQNKVTSMPSTCSIDIIDIKNLILGSILNFWGPNAVFLGLGQGWTPVLGFTHVVEQL